MTISEMLVERDDIAKRSVEDKRYFLHMFAFCALSLSWLTLFERPLRQLVGLAWQSDAYEHVLFIPFLSAVLLYVYRARIFAHLRFAYLPGIALVIAGGFISLYGRTVGNSSAELSVLMLAFVVLLIGSFTLCFGLDAARAACFPLLFLALFVPVPIVVMNGIIELLQHWSADGCALIMSLIGIPYHRDGLVFDLPGVSIFVAKECSGVHSSMALLVTVLLAVQMFLRSASRKLAVCLLILPVAVLKNAIRIVTLSALAIYVDPGFLRGRLHREGGVLFFLLGFALLMAFLNVLRRPENMLESQSVLNAKKAG